MAIQSLTGNMTTNQFGGNIVCQGATLTLSPFITFGATPPPVEIPVPVTEYSYELPK